MKKLYPFIWINLFILISLFSNVVAQQGDTGPGIDEKLDQYIPSDLIFTDENYQQIKLVDSINKPTVLALVYYNCPGICTPLLEGVAEVVNLADLKLGVDYQVFTISFNPAEKPSLAKEKKKNFARFVPNQNIDKGWTYFTGDSANIARLLNSIGYKVKKEGQEYIHPTAIVVLGPGGKITRYLYGIDFLPFDLKMAVVEASQGRSGPTINKVLRFCFSYDPDGRKYVLNITRVSGTIILTFAVVLFMVLFLRRRKKSTNVNQ
jgi:protein SCO1/2